MVWVGSFVTGTANDAFFMALPIVDNFWQVCTLRKYIFMPTPQLPLEKSYILPLIAISRTHCTTLFVFISLIKWQKQFRTVAFIKPHPKTNSAAWLRSSQCELTSTSLCLVCRGYFVCTVGCAGITEHEIASQVPPWFLLPVNCLDSVVAPATAISRHIFPLGTELQRSVRSALLFASRNERASGDFNSRPLFLRLSLSSSSCSSSLSGSPQTSALRTATSNDPVNITPFSYSKLEKSITSRPKIVNKT